MKDEKSNPITYWGGLADEAFKKENEINNLAEEVYGKGVNHDYEEGFVDGYNKAKETLYSEIEVLQLLLRLKQTESYNNLYDWFQQNKKQQEQ